MNKYITLAALFAAGVSSVYADTKEVLFFDRQFTGTGLFDFDSTMVESGSTDALELIGNATGLLEGVVLNSGVSVELKGNKAWTTSPKTSWADSVSTGNITGMNNVFNGVDIEGTAKDYVSIGGNAKLTMTISGLVAGNSYTLGFITGGAENVEGAWNTVNTQNTTSPTSSMTWVNNSGATETGWGAPGVQRYQPTGILASGVVADEDGSITLTTTSTSGHHATANGLAILGTFQSTTRYISVNKALSVFDNTANNTSVKIGVDTLTMTISGGKSWAVGSKNDKWTNQGALNVMNAYLNTTYTCEDIDNFAPVGSGQGGSWTDLTLDIDSIDVGETITLFVLGTAANNNSTMANFGVTGLDNCLIWYATADGETFVSDETYTEGTLNYTLFKVTGTLTDESIVLSARDDNKNLWGMIAYTAAVPEPSAFGLLAGIGALALVASRRRRK